MFETLKGIFIWESDLDYGPRILWCVEKVQIYFVIEKILFFNWEIETFSIFWLYVFF